MSLVPPEVPSQKVPSKQSCYQEDLIEEVIDLYFALEAKDSNPNAEVPLESLIDGYLEALQLEELESVNRGCRYRNGTACEDWNRRVNKFKRSIQDDTKMTKDNRYENGACLEQAED
ncbi:17203_t:CDS:2, partial [Dentiscutata heterogama]